MIALKFTFWLVVGFVGTELLSYYLHKYLFHGPLWFLHQTHHRSGKGVEANDVFSLFFTALAIVLMASAESMWDSIAFALGCGITLFGILYFVAHDAFTHRRFLKFNSKNKLLVAIRSAHRRHHQSVDKVGQEPFGLFWIRKETSPLSQILGTVETPENRTHKQ